MSFPDYDKYSCLLPFDGVNAATVATDWSINNLVPSFVGNAKISTAQSKYYGSSLLLDGTGDYVSLPAGSYWNVGTADFYVGIWVYPTFFDTDSNIVFSTGQSVTPWYSIRLGIGPSGIPYFYVSINGTSVISVVYDSAISLNTATHIAGVRIGPTLYIVVNGVPGTSTGNIGAGSVFYNNNPAIIGYGPDFTNAYFFGYVNDFIFCKGSSFLGSSYPAPTQLIGTITGNVKDSNNNNASRIITACPRTNPTRSFSTISDAGTGNYTLRVPATEVSRIALADEVTLYNDIVDRILVV